MWLKKILLTKYDHGADYNGFLVLNDGAGLTKDDLDKITAVADSFYRDTNSELQPEIIQTSIGEIQITGRVNKQVERRKLIEGSIVTYTSKPQIEQKVFCTKYDNEGDYSGFLLLGDGEKITDSDLNILNRVAQSFYWDSNIELKSFSMNMSIGEVNIKGSFNRQVEGRKVIVGTLNTPILIRDKNQVVKESTRLNDLLSALMDELLSSLKMSNFHNVPNFEVVHTWILAEIENRIELDAMVILLSIYKALLQGSPNQESVIKLIEYLDKSPRK